MKPESISNSSTSETLVDVPLTTSPHTGENEHSPVIKQDECGKTTSNNDFESTNVSWAHT